MPCPSCGHSLVLTRDGWKHSQRSTDCNCDCNKKISDMAAAAKAMVKVYQGKKEAVPV